ncbi:hypothetical protein TrVGV298_000691 [Trichoderma virens]|nr:hypothetical protein TrVGV298_000691 [Trichoderma virens]
MNPFPSTPAPRRFLLPRRSTQSSLSQAPGAPPRFQSTQRFGSSSAPRPTQGRELDIEESEDGEEEEVVSESSLSGDERGATETRQPASRHSVLDIESDAGVPSQEDLSPDVADTRPKIHRRFDIESESPSEGSQGTEVGREAKRRKMSISPTPLFGSPGVTHEETNFDTEDGASVMSTDSGEESPITMRNSKALQQPIFQQAPRFKPLDAANALGGLPAAFSPQRRGARYLPGGMAAQLQGWLSEIKGWEENIGKAESVIKIKVDQIRSGRRMYLIEGRDPSAEASKKWILAGEGKLTGLGKRAEVKIGSVVLIEQPVWDVELEGSSWNVACEWSVEMT